MYEERRSSAFEGTLWRARSHRAPTVLPDGCMDVIAIDGRLVVAGADTQPHGGQVAHGEQVVGLRFDPGVLPGLLGVPADELTDRRVLLAEVWDPRHAARLEEHLAHAADVWALDGALGDAFARAVDDRPDDVRAEARRHLVRRIAEGAAVADLADEMGWSERQLLRRSRAAFGYAPSMLRRVLRLQRALGAAHDGRPFVEVAWSAGYSDQAHLSRDVRALTGSTLGRLVGA